jgi:hypothetical protein
MIIGGAPGRSSGGMCTIMRPPAARGDGARWPRACVGEGTRKTTQAKLEIIAGGLALTSLRDALSRAPPGSPRLPVSTLGTPLSCSFARRSATGEAVGLELGDARGKVSICQQSSEACDLRAAMCLGRLGGRRASRSSQDRRCRLAPRPHAWHWQVSSSCQRASEAPTPHGSFFGAGHHCVHESARVARDGIGLG